MGEDAVIFVGEVELLHSKFGMILLRAGEISIDYPDYFGVFLGCEQMG